MADLKSLSEYSNLCDHLHYRWYSVLYIIYFHIIIFLHYYFHYKAVTETEQMSLIFFTECCIMKILKYILQAERIYNTHIKCSRQHITITQFGVAKG